MLLGSSLLIDTMYTKGPSTGLASGQLKFLPALGMHNNQKAYYDFIQQDLPGSIHVVTTIMDDYRHGKKLMFLETDDLY